MLKHLIRPVLALGLFACGSLLAAAEPLISEVHKDFGSVPRGTMLVHTFHLTNTTSSKLHVAGVRTSCGCATATVARSELEPEESTTIVVNLDTRKYAGARTFTIFLQIDRPFVEELRLAVQAVSREDLSMQPSQLTFGRVKKGTGPTATVAITYHGPGVWQVIGIENDNDFLLPQIKETNRLPGQATYQLSVKLREDIPVGSWHANVWLKTTDVSTPRIRVPLTVEVEGLLTATPAEVALGRVKPNSRSDRKVVIRGAKPFKILKVEGGDDRCQVVTVPTESKSVHVLNVRFTPGAQAGEFSKRFRVETDLAEEEAIEFTVQAQVQ